MTITVWGAENKAKEIARQLNHVNATEFQIVEEHSNGEIGIVYRN